MSPVTIEPLPREDLARVRHFDLPPEQLKFSGHPRDTMAAAPEGRDGHVILEAGVPVGFFAIDRDYAATHDFAPEGALGLRMFLVDGRSQGRGIASAACARLAAYLPRQYPGAAGCWLTVNLRNPAARRAYLKGGFTDTGALYHGGALGPQHILRLTLDGAAPG